MVLNGTDPDRTAAWYADVLGFRLSDTLAGPDMGTVMNFMRCNPRHHSIAFARGPHVSLHHVSFELRGIDEFMRGTGRMLRVGHPDGLGTGQAPGRVQHVRLLPRPAAQHDRVHHRAAGTRRGRLAPARLRHARPTVQDQWGTANPMNELVAKESFNDPDPGLFIAPPV